MSINWKDREVETKRQEVVVRALLNKWLEDNNDWSGEVIFSNYPPVLYIRLEIHHLNNLSDIKLDQAGVLASLLCTATKMGCLKGFRTSSNSIEYKLCVPFI